MSVFPDPERVFATVAVQRKPNGEQLGFCLSFPPAIIDRYVENDTKLMHLEILRVSTGWHVRPIDEIPENPTQRKL